MPHTCISFTVEATGAAVHRARHRVSTALSWWGGPVEEELRFSAELVTSELLTNGLRHAGGPMTVELTLVHDMVVVAVLDDSRELPRPRQTEADDECGRGLALIEDLSLIRGVETTSRGKRCWAVLPLRTPQGGLSSRLRLRRRTTASRQTGNAGHWLPKEADYWRVCFRRCEFVLLGRPSSRPRAGGRA